MSVGFIGQLSAALPAVPPTPNGGLAPAGLTGMLPFPTNAPVQIFRHLLTLSPAEREQWLSTRPESSRAVLARKVMEYASMPADQREARLRALEFHHYMNLLLHAPAAVRASWLAAVPQEYRSLCEDRLRLWVVLPPELQKHTLEREATLLWLTRWEAGNALQRQQLVAALTPERRQALERDFTQWKSSTPAEREQAWRGTRRLFEMSSREQQRVLAAIPESSRPQTVKLVDTLRQLTPAEREEYIAGWRKFAQLDSVQRAQFIQGWERWKKMSESERQVWRHLAAQVPKVPALPIPTTPTGSGIPSPAAEKLRGA